jgi:hypothetical protein
MDTSFYPDRVAYFGHHAQSRHLQNVRRRVLRRLRQTFAEAGLTFDLPKNRSKSVAIVHKPLKT